VAAGPRTCGTASPRASGTAEPRGAKCSEDATPDRRCVVVGSNAKAKEGNSCGLERSIEERIAALSVGAFVALVVELDAARNPKRLPARDNEVKVLLRDGSAKPASPVGVRAGDDIRNAHLGADDEPRLKCRGERVIEPLLSD
jgi:hypothetical protein